LVLKQVAEDQEVVIARGKCARNVALVSSEELAGLRETARLLRSPRNARRLLAALRRAERGTGKPETVEELRNACELRMPKSKRGAADLRP
jgi:antitoxin YefM